MGLLQILPIFFYFFHPLVSSPVFLLSRDIEVIQYNIELTFDDNKFNPMFNEEFDGEVEILIKPKQNISEFHINLKNLEHVMVRLYLAPEYGQKIVTTNDLPISNEIRQEHEVMKVGVHRPLQKNSIYKLHFTYKGYISPENGLIRNTFVDEEGRRRQYLVSNMRPTKARTVFPCFDEPYFRAIFEIQINRPRYYFSFSNTPLKATSEGYNDKGPDTDVFEPTPLMPTYLVAITICDFTRERPHPSDTRLITRDEVQSGTHFGLFAMQDILLKYNNVFRTAELKTENIEMDIIAYPNYTHPSLENWRLMFYDEEIIVWDQSITDYKGIQTTRRRLANDIAHIWFGQMVTPEWWSHMWLSEGFAKYYEYFMTHKVYPNMGLDKQFVINEMHAILAEDTHDFFPPITRQIITQSDINRIQHCRSFVKAACILRMISYLATVGAFDKIVADFICEFQNKTANTNDVLNQLKLLFPAEQFENLNVAEFLADWIEKPGYPLLNVELSDDKKTLEIQQTRFLFYYDSSDPFVTYTIPITLATNINRSFADITPVAFMSREEEKIVYNFSEPVDWVVLNIQQSGYYRVYYDTHLYDRLHAALLENNWSGIHELNRAQYIDDLFMFGQAGYISYDMVFKRLEYLKTEEAYAPWAAAIKGLKRVISYFPHDEQSDFSKYILFITDKIYHELGVTPRNRTDELSSHTREKIIDISCEFGRDACLKETHQLMKAFIYNDTAIPNDIRASVYCCGIRDLNETEFDFVLQKYVKTREYIEKMRLQNGLSCVRNPNSIKKYLDHILGWEVPVHDKKDALELLYTKNVNNTWTVFTLLAERINELFNIMKSKESVADIMTGITGALRKREHLFQVKLFIDNNKDLFGEEVARIETALVESDNEIRWAKRRLESLRRYLRNERWKPDVTSDSNTTYLSKLIALLSFLVLV